MPIKNFTIPLFITFIILIINSSPGESTPRSKVISWQIFPLQSHHTKKSYNQSPNKDVSNDDISDVGFADFELEDVAKRSEDDYGHMRFGRSDSYLNINGRRRSEKLIAFL
ncbi:hypothetical protein JTE90_015776 [Oedothorax gibbosus]|uniref:Uncharacterized protein n=1 Tax=Oedothorax gibbosus TaxID=931172 RepID=A0AAV6VXP5_9ARAC|nr:hypothetical protein JTE90_015776 [Oedothorax gibbosus]